MSSIVPNLSLDQVKRRDVRKTVVENIRTLAANIHAICEESVLEFDALWVEEEGIATRPHLAGSEMTRYEELVQSLNSQIRATAFNACKALDTDFVLQE